VRTLLPLEQLTAGHREELRSTCGVTTMRGDCIIRNEADMAKAPAKGSTQVEDATTLLMEDHRKVRRMFDEFKKLKSGDVEEKEDLVRKACAELKIHTTLEEEIFYPAAREKLDDASLIDEAEVEHASAKQLIGELEEMAPDENLFDAKFTVLGEYVKHHVSEEETQIFPQAKKAKVDMRALGTEIRRRREELQKQAGVSPEE
jgi:hemerythrin-like domain-containing protein